MSDTSVPVEETKVPGAGNEEKKIPVTSPKTHNGEMSGEEETKVPVTSPKSQNGEQDDGSVPVTVHLEEKQNKKPKQPSKKERADALKQKANKEFSSKRYAVSIQLYNQALELDPTNHILYSNRAAARYNLAQEIASTGEHPDAKDHRAIHAESPTWDASMSLYFGALEDGLKAIELDPNFLKAYLRVGACLKALGKYQAAVQAYEAALSRFPNEESVKQALKETREKAAQLEEGFPLYHSFINLAAQPNPRVPDPPAAQPAQSKDNVAAAAAAAAAARLHRELFGKRNALVQTPKPETRWQFYYEQPPNLRSTASWEPNPSRRQEVDEDAEDHYYQEDADEQQYHRPPPSQSRFQRSPRYQQPQFQQPQFQQPQFFHQSQPQQHRPHQSSYQQQTSQQSYQQHYQQPQQSYQAPQHRKRSDNTSFPNRKAPNGYLQELCENLRVSQYLPSLLEQGVETVDDLMLLPPEAIQSIFPTLGHQARVLDWLKKARGEM